mgnify:CR=1 FL=1
MKLRIKCVLWICLSVTLLLLLPSVKLRISNENANRSVILAADIQEFASLWTDSIESLVQKLKDSSIQTAVVKEDAVQSSQNICSFDIQLIENLRKQDMDVILQISGVYHDAKYYGSLKNIITHYGIRYIQFESPLAPSGSEDNTPAVFALKESGVILLLVENAQQTGHAAVPGLDPIISSMDYAAGRAYITPPGDLAALGEEDLLFRWLRGVVDRSIRFIYVQPFQSGSSTALQNLEGPLEASTELSILLDQKGYKVNQPVLVPSPRLSGPFHILLILLNLLLAFSLGFCYLFTPNKRFWLWTAFSGISSAVLFLLFQDSTALVLEATAASVLYPSLAVIVLLVYLKNTTHKKIWMHILHSLALLALCTVSGVLSILAAMSDVRFTLHLVNFSGSLLTYTLPLVTFVAGYLLLFKSPGIWGLIMRGIRSKKGNPSHFLLGLAGIAVFYIYLSRSGNYSLIPASVLELNIRKTLERFMTVRPRFKEFLVGYPCFFLFVLLCKRTAKSLVPIILGLGTTIGIISIFNSFCHGFTSVRVSVYRTLNGFVLGLMIGLAALLLVTVFHKALAVQTYSNSSNVRKKLGMKFFIK